MEVSCPRCDQRVRVDEQERAEDGRIRIRCPGCDAGLVVKVNRPALRIDERMPTSDPGSPSGEAPLPSPRGLDALGGFSIDLGSDDDDDESTGFWVVVVRQMIEEQAGVLRRLLMEIPRFTRNPNKLHDITAQLPYVLSGLTQDEAERLESLLDGLGATCEVGPEWRLLDQAGQLVESERPEEGLLVQAGEDPSAVYDRPDDAVVVLGEEDLEDYGDPDEGLLVAGIAEDDDGEEDDDAFPVGAVTEQEDLLALAAGDDEDEGLVVAGGGEDDEDEDDEEDEDEGLVVAGDIDPDEEDEDERLLVAGDIDPDDEDEDERLLVAGDIDPDDEEDEEDEPPHIESTGEEPLIELAPMPPLRPVVDFRGPRVARPRPATEPEGPESFDELVAVDAAEPAQPAVAPDDGPLLVTMDEVPGMGALKGLLSASVEVGAEQMASGSRSDVLADAVGEAQRRLEDKARRAGETLIVGVRTTASDLGDGAVLVVTQGTMAERV